MTRRREAPVDEAPDVVDAGSDFALGIVERDALDAALALLPPDFRVALVLREYADMSYAEIAEAQGVGIQTVKSRLNRARRAVQTLLQDT